MAVNEDYYSALLPDDGLINDYELERRLHYTNVMDDLLNHDRNRKNVFGRLF